MSAESTLIPESGNRKPERTEAAWNTGVPDAEMTVLMRLDDDEYPVWPGFYDGECWRSADAEPLTVAVLGWLELEQVAQILDA